MSQRLHWILLDHLQKALMESRICLLNAGPTGTETLKNLVLPGCGSITVVDGHLVTERDLANNFFVSREYLGLPRAKAALELLVEMNDDVKGNFVFRDPMDIVTTESSFFAPFTLVIATQMPEDSLKKVASVLWQHNVPLMVVRSYGLIGYLRLVKPEHCIVESKLEASKPYLRIGGPWPALRAYADAIDLAGLDDMTHAHVPYVALLVKALDQFRGQHGGQAPKNIAQKSLFKDMLKGMRRIVGGAAGAAHASDDAAVGGAGEVLFEANFDEALEHAYQAYASEAIPHEVQDILNDSATEKLSAASDNFWFAVRALREFAASHGCLPVAGVLPDMTATTEMYIALQKVYQSKANADCAEVSSHVGRLLSAAGLPTDRISSEYVHLVCKNARNLRLLRYRSLEDELAGCASTRSSVQEEMSMAAEEVDGDGMDVDGEESAALKQSQQKPIAWYIMLRAADRFVALHGRYPGQASCTTEAESSAAGNGSDESAMLEADSSQLWAIAQALCKAELGLDSIPSCVLNAKHAQEIVRYGGCEIHTTAAVMGGVASQEAVKLLTSQYVPLDNTFIHNGIAGVSGVLQL